MKTLKLCNSLPVSRKQARMLVSNIRLDIYNVHVQLACMSDTQQRKAGGCGFLMVHIMSLSKLLL